VIVACEDSNLDPLLVIIGPTASGKSRLALDVAEEISGEIISADAFAVYKGLDIGTDKPDADARQRIRHHLVDVADPRNRYSAGAFAQAASEAIQDIRSRGRTPIVAGGTHFYVRALIMGLFPSPPHDPEVRASLEDAWNSCPAALYADLCRTDPEAAARIGPNDRQRILRAMEVFRLTSVPISVHWRHHGQAPRYRSLLAAPAHEREALYARINRRVDSMFASGLEEEISKLLVSGIPRDAHAFKAIGYKQVVRMLDGQWDRAAAIDQTKQASRKLAKRQLTWLRSLSEGSLQWVPAPMHGGASTIISSWHRHIGGSDTK
jgi:tRNA dimethylallyltransferase